MREFQNQAGRIMVPLRVNRPNSTTIPRHERESDGSHPRAAAPRKRRVTANRASGIQRKPSLEIAAICVWPFYSASLGRKLMSMTYFLGLLGSTSTSIVSSLMYSLGSNQMFSLSNTRTVFDAGSGDWEMM